MYQIYLNETKTNVISKYLSNDVLNHIALFIGHNVECPSTTKILRQLIKDFSQKEHYKIIVIITTNRCTCDDGLAVSEIYYFVNDTNNIIKANTSTLTEPIWTIGGNLHGFKEIVKSNYVCTEEQISVDKISPDFTNLYLIDSTLFETYVKKLHADNFVFNENDARMIYKNLSYNNINLIVNHCLKCLEQRMFPKYNDITKKIE
ncbi:hypothetical protein Catovirus_1_353 [Catovirus CTV1]|uniref:Uncharacterized protein n=1 Tax=Catovirus CTV1 TaxID=1977631 RepID=A0A1V0S9B5_9VIRU|nr:hypothetical protein Catovirus_1_353 [Catovirus CTV1]